METKSFVKILRKVIREEVRSAVKEMLVEQKKPARKVIDHGLSLHKMVEQNDRPKKKFSNNSMLNDILNETSADFNPTEFRGEPAYPTMQDQAFTSDQAPGFASMMNNRNLGNTIPTTDINGAPVNSAALPDTLTKALTRDYSGLMGAIDKKKGIK